MNKIALIIVSLILALIMGLAGCATQPATVTITPGHVTVTITQPTETMTVTNTEITIPPMTTVVPPTVTIIPPDITVELPPPPVTPTTQVPGQPEYIILTYTVEPGVQDYVFLSPIYLRNDQTLHLFWIVKEDKDVWFHIHTPSNIFLGFYTDGEFANGTLSEGFCQGFPAGATTFSPSDYDWGEGYYDLLVSEVSNPLTIEVRYWIEG